MFLEVFTFYVKKAQWRSVGFSKVLTKSGGPGEGGKGVVVVNVLKIVQIRFKRQLRKIEKNISKNVVLTRNGI